MMIQFNGIRGSYKRTGCPVCGGRRKRKASLEVTKTMMLPSGRSITFMMGKPKSVNDAEGNYLKNWHYTYAGVEYYPFIEVVNAEE